MHQRWLFILKSIKNAKKNTAMYFIFIYFKFTKKIFICDNLHVYVHIYVSHKSHALKQKIITICCGIFYMTLHVMPSENFGLWSSLGIFFKIKKCFLTEFLNILILLSLSSIEICITLFLQARIKARLNIIDEIVAMLLWSMAISSHKREFLTWQIE